MYINFISFIAYSAAIVVLLYYKSTNWRAVLGLTAFGVACDIVVKNQVPATGVACLILVLIAYKTPSLRLVSARYVATTLVVIASTALALHKIPGFENPVVATTDSSVRFGLDKCLGAIPLLILIVNRGETERFDKLNRLTLVAIAATVGFYAMAWGLNLIHLNVRLDSNLAPFLLNNLFSTCVFEEALFRGVLQRKLADICRNENAGLVIASLLFGAAHLPLGLVFATLAAAVGCSYGYIYREANSIKLSIAYHFLFNTVFAIFFAASK